MKENILVTGSAGFIGFHLVKKLLSEGFKVCGIDNLNDYYDTSLKESRLSNIKEYVKKNSLDGDYVFEKADLNDITALKEIFVKHKIDFVINLAAQAGVRYSILNPQVYVDSNLSGFTNILECSRRFKVKHLIFASSSSVYGNNQNQPLKEDFITDKPISFYAATKKANEVQAFSYSHLYNIKCTGLRFFTVYGPFGRPDMAYFKFANLITSGKEINVYNNGKMERDFTYIDDVTEAISKIFKSPTNTSETEYFNIFNIGNNKPEPLEKLISLLEKNLECKAKKNYMPIQPGDVTKTFADISKIKDAIGFKNSTSLEKGIEYFVSWYKAFYFKERNKH